MTRTSDLDLDQQIAAAERSIEQRTQRVLADARLLKRAVRGELTSPASLLFAAGVGFTLGRITESTRALGQTRLARIWTSDLRQREDSAQSRAAHLLWCGWRAGSEPREPARISLGRMPIGATE